MAEPVELNSPREVFSFPVNSLAAARFPYRCPKAVLLAAAASGAPGAARCRRGERRGVSVLRHLCSREESKWRERPAPAPAFSDEVGWQEATISLRGALSLPGKLWAFVLFQG